MIRYALHMLNMPIGYYLTAAALGAGLFLWKKQWELSALAAYCFLVFAMAVLHRTASAEPHYILQPFWSWRAWDANGIQILANIAVFVPIGFLAARLWNGKGLLLSAAFSVLIETTQLVTHRGFFEFDDMIHNTLGAALGLGLCILVRMLTERAKSRQRSL